MIFGGVCYRKVYDLLERRAHVEEDSDAYVYTGRPDDSEDTAYRYRELKRSGVRGAATTSWDRKRVLRCLDSQVPYIDGRSGRVIFVTTTHKTSVEERLTEEQWNDAVREDHTADTTFRRVYNKHRLAFPPESFVDLFGGAVPEFTRLSLGEYSAYGGTLEARTKCNPVYYLEIENETEHEVDDVQQHTLRLVEILFTVLPYGLVAETMRKNACATVQRERVDCVFEEFKRRFVNYHRCRRKLWRLAGRQREEAALTGPGHVKMFVMPKWDGRKATANYCEGFLFVKDSCGSLSTYRADLPFDNDVILQLELLDDDCGRRLMVVTEILAVVVKTHNTLYHVYNRNNTLHDTGRNAGNVTTGITLKSQFTDPNNVCNPYRLVAPSFSLLVIQRLSAKRWASNTTAPTAAVNTYMRSDTPELFLTTVAETTENCEEVLRLLDRFHNYGEDGERSVPSGGREERRNRRRCIRRLSTTYLPDRLLEDARYRKHCEGLLVVFARCGDTLATASHHRPKRRRLPDHGYVKIKRTDTVDLEYNVSLGLATTSSGKHRFTVRDVPDDFRGWSERPRPVTDDRLIIECFYDRDRRSLVFFKDRPDKSKADSDEKICATNHEIIEVCALDRYGADQE